MQGAQGEKRQGVHQEVRNNQPIQEEIKKKTKENNLKKYGVEHTLQVQEIRDKGKETMVELYGVEHASQNPELLQKRVDTYIKHYGTENPLQNAEVKARRKKPTKSAMEWKKYFSLVQ